MAGVFDTDALDTRTDAPSSDAPSSVQLELGSGPTIKEASKTHARLPIELGSGPTTKEASKTPEQENERHFGPVLNRIPTKSAMKPAHPPRPLLRDSNLTLGRQNVQKVQFVRFISPDT